MGGRKSLSKPFSLLAVPKHWNQITVTNIRGCCVGWVESQMLDSITKWFLAAENTLCAVSELQSRLLWRRKYRHITKHNLKLFCCPSSETLGLQLFFLRRTYIATQRTLIEMRHFLYVVCQGDLYRRLMKYQFHKPGISVTWYLIAVRF